MKSTEELKRVLDLLKKEKEEEIKQYEKLIKQTPLKERVKKGVCWNPVKVESWGWGLGEHPYLIVHRTKGVNQAHKFRAGQVVHFFNEKLNKEVRPEYGIINYIKKDKAKIILYGTELPNWLIHNTIGMQLSFDERSYQEMERAMEKVIAAKGDRLAELREVLLAKKTASFHQHSYNFDIPKLNKSQCAAVHQILDAEDVAVIHGPPGTGKTTTLVEALRQLCKRESPVLVCAPSNAATDLLTEKLAEVRLNVVRIGNVSRVDESLLQHTIEGILNEHPGMQEVKKMKIESAQIRRKAEKFKRNFGHKEREERRAAYQEARALIQHAKMLEDYIIDKVLKEADVITCTLVGAQNPYIAKKTFKTVVIDEAAQALEPATWIPITKAERVIFAGDPFQLPPTVKSVAANKGGLAVTLLEKCVERLEHVQLLDTQYRMNSVIMEFSNQQFYNGALKAAEFVADWKLPIDEIGERPVEFIDTAGCGFDEEQHKESLSYRNPEEYYVLRQHLDHLLTFADGQPISIGIISPYKEQVIFMQEHIPVDFDHFPDANITVNTIDSFQGQERDVIYISMVRSNEDQQIGFLKDTRRMNVAMTRARKKLIIIGDSATLGNFQFYQRFLDYCDTCNAYSTAWEWK
ncbi:MAG: AAA domain-containing protein [Saprospiraceae bacterium]|nr:AAA domain-containing protein [Saprospiraceae bacterium]